MSWYNKGALERVPFLLCKYKGCMLLKRNKSSLCLDCLVRCCFLYLYYFITARNCVCSKRCNVKLTATSVSNFLSVWFLCLFLVPKRSSELCLCFFVKIASFKMQRNNLLLQMCLIDQPACEPITDEYRIQFEGNLLRCLWVFTESNQSIHPFNQPSIHCPPDPSSIHPSVRPSIYLSIHPSYASSM